MKTKPKILAGIVVSDRLPKTVVVEIRRLVKHPKYGKYIRRSKRYLAHDEIGHKVGDRVKIKETRPMSRRKHFAVI
ncbi:MAG: 30S ribosomal protein S17 [Candidatus Vogelbacteria bacterium]|nr:30S ribosomal protein S17 [Candidatus Vogelbacteria bacterium]